MAQIEQLLVTLRQQAQLHWLTEITWFRPPKFEGQENPIILQDWIGDFERLYTATGCPKERWVDIAVFHLRGSADKWWIQRQASQGEKNLTWDQFKEALTEKFSPDFVKRMVYRDFMSLRQGDMTVEEYYTKFAEFVRFAPEVEASEWLKAYHFEHGLNCNIQDRLRGELFTDLQTVYVRARNIFQGKQNLNWGQFEEALREPFHPDHVKIEKYDELMTMWQGDMTVEEYYAKFKELIEFVPEVSAGEWSKNYRFMRGLDFDIQLGLEVQFSTEFTTVYEQARCLFWKLKEIRKAEGRKRKHKGDQRQGKDKRLQFGGGNQSGGANQGSSRHYYCNRCGGDHPGKDCKGNLVVCFGCGKKGHRVFECWHTSVDGRLEESEWTEYSDPADSPGHSEEIW